VENGTVGFLDPQNLQPHIHIRRGMKIADFGSGSGDFSLWVARQLGGDGLVSSIDVRREALDVLKEKLKVEHLNNVELIHGDLEAPSGSTLRDESHDLVLLINTLFWAEDKRAMIKEANRVIRGHGHILAVEWKKNAESGAPKGLGPPQSVRIASSDMKELLTGESTKIIEEFDASQLHYGMLVQKVTGNG
jgi:ubiquinone/menaquinone biosynthesis C-methylase UbiE